MFDEIDKQLLNIIQSEFPIEKRPYEALGNRLSITADEALRRVSKLVDDGVIRKIGPSFDTRKLGHVSTLVAAKVPQDRLKEVADFVSSFPEVTHNYGRDFEYNLWFAVVSESSERVNTIIERVKSETGVSDIYSLPAERMFKIKVNFEF